MDLAILGSIISAVSLDKFSKKQNSSTDHLRIICGCFKCLAPKHLMSEIHSLLQWNLVFLGICSVRRTEDWFWSLRSSAYNWKHKSFTSILGKLFNYLKLFKEKLASERFSRHGRGVEPTWSLRPLPNQTPKSFFDYMSLNFMDVLHSVKQLCLSRITVRKIIKGKSTDLHHFMQGDKLRHREQWRNSNSFNQSSGTSETANAFSVTHPKNDQKEVIINFIILY